MTCGRTLVALACVLAALCSQAAAGRILLQASSGGQSASAAGQLPAALNSFGDSLYGALLSQGQGAGAGAFLSPFSIAQAMGMLLNGADPQGQSYAQLLSVVFGQQQQQQARGGAGPLGVAEVNAGMKSLGDALLQVAGGSNLTVSNANSAWLQRQYALQPAFEQALARYYSAQVEPITTAQAVNSWVANATRGKITEIVNAAALREAVLLLVNALYFKGKWASPFQKDATRPMPFRQLSGGSVTAAMMAQEFEGETRGLAQVARFSAPVGASGSLSIPCVAVRLPYQGQQYAAVLTMPAGNVSAMSAGPLRLVSPASLPYQDALSACRTQLIKGLQGGAAGLAFAPAKGSLILYLPRYEIEYEASLKAPLQQLGLAQPFIAAPITDLTRIATLGGQPATNIYVSDVLHKIYIKVDEVGTEAAAVTSIMARATSAPLGLPETITFDRPFAMAVVHEGTGAVLFMGEVDTPEQWAGSSAAAGENGDSGK